MNNLLQHFALHFSCRRHGEEYKIVGKKGSDKCVECEEVRKLINFFSENGKTIKLCNFNEFLTALGVKGRNACEFVKEKYEVKKYYATPETKQRIKEYYSRPEVKQKIKEYREKYYAIPGIKQKIKEYLKKYHMKPEIIQKRKEYNAKPEVKQKMKEYYKEYYAKPEVRQRINERTKKRYAQKKSDEK